MLRQGSVEWGVTMGFAVRKQQSVRQREEAMPLREEAVPLRHLAKLASVDIETKLVGDLSHDLHAMFDPVSSDTLPIYFGPLLGRLYLEGL